MGAHAWRAAGNATALHPPTCFETFPFPTPTAAQEQAIAAAARVLDAARANWLGDRSEKTRTLTALYNKKPTWLADAHRALDEAVFAAYGWRTAPEHPGEGGPVDMTDEQILERILALNLSRSTASSAPL